MKFHERCSEVLIKASKELVGHDPIRRRRQRRGVNVDFCGEKGIDVVGDSALALRQRLELPLSLVNMSVSLCCDSSAVV